MNKIWEFKVEYKIDNELDVRNHYFSAESYEEAKGYHDETISRHKQTSELLSVERKCPYSNKWVKEDDDNFLKDLKK
jgi:hypothetical protein